MKSILRALSCVALLHILPSTLSAQNLKNFSEDPAAFLKELDAYLESADKKVAKEIIGKLTAAWKYDRFTPAQKQNVIELGNAMLKKRMNAIPNFRDYIEAVLAYGNSKLAPEVFDQWVDWMLKVTPKLSNNRFVALMGFSEALFAQNALHATNAFSWIASEPNYEFGVDSLPFLKFSNIDLTCRSRRDTSTIYNTRGTLYPTEIRFIGQGGNIDWTRVGLKKEEASAQLKRYEISLKTARFDADSATFYFPRYFSQPLLGKVSDKLSDSPDLSKVNFPQFTSYLAEFKIPNLFPDIDYEGGLSVQGRELIGSGNNELPAKFVFKREKQAFLIARSKSFLIEEKGINSAQAAVFIALNEDSITHPGLNFKYLHHKREVSLIRDYQGISKSLYYNSFHRLEMDVEVVNWNMEENTLRFGAIPGSMESKAIFESLDYFRAERFLKIQGIDAENPVTVVNNYVDKVKRDYFTVSEFASFYRTDITVVRQILMRLSYQGFLTYNHDEQMVYVKPRVKKYILNVNGRADYDVITLNSTVKGNESNAALSLLNYDLRINGVKRIFLSDSQNVVIYPKSDQIVMQGNRDFTFEGRIQAGRFELFGKKFSFFYDKFKLDLENVDSLRFSVKSNEKNEFGEDKLVKVKTVIEQINGNMLIDHPNNKSGVKPLAQYPIFNSFKNSYAFYEKRSVLNGVYKRNNFYFQLDPFQVDSLDSFTNEGIDFQGTFYSAGIFPEIRESLKLQPDFSLGFVRKTGAEGIPIYGGKGKFIDQFQLSNKGVRGGGTIEYITTVAKSKDFVFYPDSVNALCQTLTVAAQEGGVQFADLQAVDVKLHWRPYEANQFNITQTTEAMAMYGGETKMKGKVSIGENGMTGAGTLEFASAEVQSKKFSFLKENFKADTSSFSFTSREVDDKSGVKEVAIKTDNVKADVSFKNRVGQFKSNSPESYIEFPVNKYIAYMDELRWYMDKDEVDMNSSSNDIDLIGARFLSVKPDQDSLTFVAPRARYALKDRTIFTDGVKLIRVADASIYPNEEKVNVERNAVITTLKNSRINANYDLKYHDLYNATIDILGKKKYTAQADYDYEDADGKTQRIRFTTIKVDSALNTVGFAEVADTAKFKLSQVFEYKGRVKLFAPDKHLEFDGGVRIVHGCEKINRNWLRFKAPIDPNNIIIPVDTFPKTPDGEKLTAGLVLIKDSTHVYPVFLSRKQKAADQDIITSYGFMRYDKNKQEFQIASKEKLSNMDLPGQYIAMKTGSCDVFAEGKMSVGADLGQVKYEMVGQVNHSLEKDETLFNVTLSIDFFFNDDMLKIINESVAAVKDLQSLDLTTVEFRKNTQLLMGKEASAKLFKDLGNTGVMKKVPEELQSTFVFSNLKLRWNTESRSFVSQGWLGVQSIGKVPVNRLIKGKLEITKKRGGDILNFYLEPESNNWFFFNYTRNIMGTLSGVDNYNKIVKELDSSKREQKVESGKPPFQYTIGIEKRKRDFVDK